VSFSLTGKDLDRLVLIGLLGFASSAQIAQELDSEVKNPDEACSRRMRRLFDVGLVDKWVLDSKRPDIYALTRQGHALLARKRPGVASRMRRAGAPKLSTIDHVLATGDARRHITALAGGGWFSPQVRVGRWHGGRTVFVTQLGLGSLVPDGVFQCADHVVAVEVDTGEESGRVLTRKFGRYLGPLTGGAISEVWVVALGGTRRLETVRGRLVEAGIDDRARLLSHALTLSRPVAPPSAVVRALRGDDADRGLAHPPQPQGDRARHGHRVEARPPHPGETAASGVSSLNSLSLYSRNLLRSRGSMTTGPALDSQVDPHGDPHG